MRKIDLRLKIKYCIAAFILNVVMAWISVHSEFSFILASAAAIAVTAGAIGLATVRGRLIPTEHELERMRLLITNSTRFIGIPFALSVLALVFTDKFDKPRMLMHLAALLCFFCTIFILEKGHTRLLKEIIRLDDEN